MKIKMLTQENWQSWKLLRLEALKNSHESFGSSYEKELNWPDLDFQNSLTKSDIFGVFIDNLLVSCAGMEGNVCNSIGKYQLIHNNSVIHAEIEELKVRIYGSHELTEILKNCGFKVRAIKAFDSSATPDENDEAVVYECRK